MLDTLTWIAPDGDEIVLTDLVDLIDIEPGMVGRGIPPVRVTGDELAGVDGQRVRHVRYQAREVEIPVTIEHASPEDLRSKLRQLGSLLDPKRGDGKLRAEGDGASRELLCRYTGGLELTESFAASVVGWVRAVLILTAHDPLWRDVEPSVELVDVEANAFLSSDSGDAWFPWQLVDSDAVGGFTVDNDGDDDAWPQWTIQGPGSGLLKLENSTSGETIEISNVDLAAGEKITIDTRPGYKTVTGPSGENLWPELSDDSILWPLERGSQKVTVTLEGAEAGVSNVRLEWRRKWLTV